MRYTIGCKVLDKDGTIVDGVYVFTNKYGLPIICNDINKIKDERHLLYCIKELEDAQNYIRYLSRLYRTEFRQRAKKLNVSVDNFRFYLMKLDSDKFGNFSIMSSSKATDKNVEYVNLNNVRIISIK
jgi:hypothetical protein